MKIVGRTVSDTLWSILREVESRCGEIQFHKQDPQGNYGSYQLKDGQHHIWVRTDSNLTSPQFEHIVAHEMMHAVQVEQNWPTAKAAQDYGDGSCEAKLVARGLQALGDEIISLGFARQLARELHSLVLDLDVEDRLKKLERSCRIVFDRTYQMEGRYQNLKRRLEPGSSLSPGSFNLEYERLALSYAQEMSSTSTRKASLQKLYLKHAPSVAEKGKELLRILGEKGWGNPEQALTSMIAIRDSLGLAKTCIIVNPRSESGSWG